MSADGQKSRNLPLLGHALLLGCALGGLWLAGGVILPSALYVMRLHDTQIPAFFDIALRIQPVCLPAVYPLAFTGVALLIVASLRRGSPRLVAICRSALAILAGVVACLSLYLLGSGGVAFKVASGDQQREATFYKRTLDQFALLEAAEGRYDKLRESFENNRDMKLVEVKNASEFNDAEARERVSALIGALPKATDMATKKRILATLCLFRERIRQNSYEARELPRYATEAGAPQTDSHVEALQWVATSLNKDGWDPLPLFKLSR